jgi:hypothetical protein
MTLRGIPQGGVPIGMMNAVQGTAVAMNLTALTSGNSQNAAGSLLPSDLVLITTADGTNKGVTLPDPNKYGGAPGDIWVTVNANSGQNVSVYPPTGGNISNAGANTASTLTNNKVNNYYLVSFTATTSVWTVDAGA